MTEIRNSVDDNADVIDGNGSRAYNIGGYIVVILLLVPSSSGSSSSSNKKKTGNIKHRSLVQITIIIIIKDQRDDG